MGNINSDSASSRSRVSSITEGEEEASSRKSFVSRCRRKLLPRLGVQREARRQKSKKRSKVECRESRLELRDKDVQEVDKIISNKRQIP